jgi:hypothetical protein
MCSTFTGRICNKCYHFKPSYNFDNSNIICMECTDKYNMYRDDMINNIIPCMCSGIIYLNPSLSYICNMEVHFKSQIHREYINKQ